VESIIPKAGSRLFPDQGPAEASVRRYVDLLRIIAARILQTRYRGSVLGVFWSLSNPLLMTAVYALIFGTAFARYYDGSIVRYIFATFVGLGILQVFSGTTSQALASIVANGALLNKVRLPYSIFPLSTVAANFFQFFVGTLPVLAIVTLIESRNPVNLIALLVPVFALIMVITGFALLTSSLYVHFRDMPYLYEMMVFVIWMTSPIFYPAKLVPPRVEPYLALNPIVSIVSSIRQIVLSKEWPDVHLMGASLLSGCVCLILGSLVFNYMKRDFMDLL
jgi:ABC-type polysaccharide/polyol phosphate export permease